MKKLNLQGKKRSDLISDFKNQIARYTDILCEKKDLNEITYDQILFFLKNTTPPNGRIDKFKKFLKTQGIAYESGLWTWHNKELE